MSNLSTSIDRNYPKYPKILLNRWPAPKDNFDMCVTFINQNIYFCVRAGNRWYKTNITESSYFDSTQYFDETIHDADDHDVTFGRIVCNNDKVVCNNNEVIYL